jgi:hypothetical protein
MDTPENKTPDKQLPQDDLQQNPVRERKLLDQIPNETEPAAEWGERMKTAKEIATSDPGTTKKTPPPCQ